MDITLTYGFMPSEVDFDIQFSKYVRGKVYRIRNDKRLGDMDLSCTELYRFCDSKARTLWQDGELDQEMLDTVSCILETLSIEWI